MKPFSGFLVSESVQYLKVGVVKPLVVFQYWKVGLVKRKVCFVKHLSGILVTESRSRETL